MAENGVGVETVHDANVDVTENNNGNGETGVNANDNTLEIGNAENTAADDWMWETLMSWKYIDRTTHTPEFLTACMDILPPRLLQRNTARYAGFVGSWEVDDVCLLSVSGVGITSFCTTAIPDTMFICEYAGVMMLGEPARGQKYAMPVQNMRELPKSYVDSRHMGNFSRMITHSNYPNCRIENWMRDGYPVLLVRAARNIPAGDALTLAYPQMFHGGLTRTNDQ